MKPARQVPRVNVKSRHRAECKHRSDGNYIRCTCPKQLLWSERGKLRRVSAETDDLEIAERKARELEARFERAVNGQPEPEKQQLTTVKDAVDRFLQTKRDANYTAKSIGKLELWFAKRLVDFCNRHNLLYISDIKIAHLEQWRSEWEGEASSRVKIQSRVKGFFKWCVGREYILRNPAEGLEKIKNGERKPTIALDETQFESVLNAVNVMNGQTTDRTRQRLRALILLMRWSGLAIRDAANLERTKLKPDVEGWYKLFLRRAKTGVEVYCTIAPEVAAEVLAVPNDHPKYFFWDGKGTKDTLVQEWQRLFRKVSEKAALKDEHGEPLDFHSHMLRDTFAVWCFNQDMSTEDVATLLGHSNIQITQQHYSPWIKSRQERLSARLRDAYNRRSQSTRSMEQAQTAG